MAGDLKREGKYLAKLGDGNQFPSDYGIYTEQTAEIIPTDYFLVGSSFCSPGKAHDFHSHDDCDEVILFQGGEGIFTVGDEKYEIREGDMFYAPKGVAHAAENTSVVPLRMTVVKVKERYSKK
ncbi:cupin domain-containing protein [Christensenellaceae bacterium OttesenSCG-928-K19]|nr:cupin domain-containing protein [Christensenellaceae bacterium OttesenSCG-928-K19]